MGFRFWRRKQILPGVTLNLSKSGPSLSFGPRGLKYTIGGSGQRFTCGLPGTGLYYTKKISGKKKKQKNAHYSEAVQDTSALDLGFFKRLITPDYEEAFVDGCRNFIQGKLADAYTCFQKGLHLADGAFFAGALALQFRKPEKAASFFEQALVKSDELGKTVQKYGIHTVLSLHITEEITAHTLIDRKGTLLGMVEAYQASGDYNKAIDALQTLLDMEPDDMIIKLSICEFLMTSPHHEDECRTVANIAEGIENFSEVEAGIMLYQGMALRELGLVSAAKDILTKAFRRKKDRSSELLTAIRYERALTYLDLGQQRKAKGEFEKIYVKNPGYRDIKRILSLSR